MKKSANGNMYAAAAQEAGELFSSFLSGCDLPLSLVASGIALSEQARTALSNSMQRLGYGDACAFAVLECAEGKLDASSLFMMIEGLDPLCVVAADADSATLLAEAYRHPVPIDRPSRLLGRPIVAFNSFEAMLSSPDDKQRAWALLKKIPRRDG